MSYVVAVVSWLLMHFSGFLQCDLYAKGEIVGNLCPALCIDQKIKAPACHTFRGGKEAVFLAEKDDGTQLIFKYSGKFSRVRTFSKSLHQMLILIKSLLTLTILIFRMLH